MRNRNITSKQSKGTRHEILMCGGSSSCNSQVESETLLNNEDVKLLWFHSLPLAEKIIQAQRIILLVQKNELAKTIWDKKQYMVFEWGYDLFLLIQCVYWFQAPIVTKRDILFY